MSTYKLHTLPTTGSAGEFAPSNLPSNPGAIESYPELTSINHREYSFEYCVDVNRGECFPAAASLPEKNSLRFLNQVWWLGMIVLMTAFTGHMKAMMMVKPEPIRLNSMADLARRDMPVHVWKGTAYEALLKVFVQISIEYCRYTNIRFE